MKYLRYFSRIYETFWLYSSFSTWSPFDGDRENILSALTEEARNEIIQYKKQKRAYVGPDGSIRYSVNYDTVKFVCHNLSDVPSE